MNKLLSCFVFLLCVVAHPHGLAGEAHDKNGSKDAEAPRLILLLDDGSRITGMTSMKAVPIQAAFGKMTVPLEQGSIK